MPGAKGSRDSRKTPQTKLQPEEAEYLSPHLFTEVVDTSSLDCMPCSLGNAREAREIVWDTALVSKFQTMIQAELTATTNTLTNSLTHEIHKIGACADQLECKLDDVIMVLDSQEKD